MQLIKLSLSFLAVGGATYAVFKVKEAPAWLVAAILAMAAATLITALPELPRAVDAVIRAGEKIFDLAASRRSSNQVPTREAPYSAPREFTPPAQPEPYPPTVVAPSQRPKIAAIVMSNRGGWASSQGIGQTCQERLDRARETCNSRVAGQCGNYACGPWVVGIHCGNREPRRIVRNSFAASGATEDDAFGRVFEYAAARGFPYWSCRKRVSISADETAPRKYD